MSDIILKVENVSKQYQLGTFGTKTIGGDVHRWWTTMVLGKEDPFLKVGEVNDRTSKEKAEFVWALKDINFEVKRGEVLGIIGKNGAGKSTLLKLLSRITSPTTGIIKSAGRMASLLEVGTGFHPELTGRENIFLNGAILGMTKKEILNKFDEIVDFSGCELYIDTPTKRYSSGMTVRLGFAVAAFLDPEILIVDEVLAVGDAEFQKKAIGKMQDISKVGGRTVLFVSHNMSSIRNLCSQALILENGKILTKGPVDELVSEYLNRNITNSTDSYVSKEPAKNEGVFLREFRMIKSEKATDILITNQIGFLIKYSIIKDGLLPDLSILLTSLDEVKILHSVFKTKNYTRGEYSFEVWFPADFFNNMGYFITLGISSVNPVKIYKEVRIKFEVNEDLQSKSRTLTNYLGEYHGVLRPELNWVKRGFSN